MTAAIFGLIGVVIGALITGGMNYALQVRAEGRELRAVARLMLQELSSTAASIRFALDHDNRRLLEEEEASEDDEWTRHHLLLARHLADDEWDAVALGYGEAMALAVLVGQEDGPRWQDHAKGVLESVDTACEVLRARAHRKGWEQPDL